MTGEETRTKNLPSTGTISGAAVSLYPRIAERVERGDRDRGATLVEYGLLLVLVLLVAFFSIQIFGETIIALFETTSDTLDNAPNNNSN